MLFLAVFCGFLAENQREHYIEHQREKQYTEFMHTMLEDLKTDTRSNNRHNQVCKENQPEMILINSLIDYLKEINTEQNLYYCIIRQVPRNVTKFFFHR